MHEFFRTRVLVTEQGCWEWRLFQQKGYGKVRHPIQKKTVRASRLSYELHVGPIPGGLTIDHLCFNPPCVNPAHLRVVTMAENLAARREGLKTHCANGHEFTPENTRIRRGPGGGRRSCKTCHRERERAAYYKRPSYGQRPGKARGERNGASRLTAEDVLEIRARAAAGESISSIARHFGVAWWTVSEVIRGNTWAHVTGQAVTP